MNRERIPLARWRRLAPVAVAAVALAASATPAAAISYASGHVIYVAYRNNPAGAEYIVDLGPVGLFTTATSTFTLNDVSSSDLNSIVGASATNIFVGLFGVLDPVNLDGLLAANGPKDDFALLNSSFIGAVQQVDSFGGGLGTFGSPVPSGNTNAVSFPSNVTGSYQATLNGAAQGSLGANVTWSVETRLSSSTGVRISAPVKIRAYRGQNNPVAGTHGRAQIGFFTLNPNGTLTYSPDADGDLVADDVDLCPGVSSPNNTDADGDLRAAPCDCNDADAAAWALPGSPVQNVNEDANGVVSWTAPASMGGTAVIYDVFRGTATTQGIFPASWACARPDSAGLTFQDASVPAPRQSFLYAIRPQNSCGFGPISTTLNGISPAVASCP